MVMLTLALLLAMLMVSLRLSLGSSVTTARQSNTLVAQYRAESNLNIGRSTLRDVQRLMTNAKFVDASGNEQTGFLVPEGTTKDTVKRLFAEFCGYDKYDDIKYDALPGYAKNDPIGKQKADGTYATLASFEDAQRCQISNSLSLDSKKKQANVLSEFVNPVYYNLVLPAKEVPSDKSAFWQSLFTSTDNDLTKGKDYKFKVIPLDGIRIDDNTFRFYMATSDMSARGVDGGGTRVLGGKNDINAGTWYFDLKLPSLTDNVLFTNKHRSPEATAPNINFTNGQVFDGDVFTNEKFLFSGSDVNTIFKGKVQSAGCEDLDTTKTCAGDEKVAGVYIAGALSGKNQPNKDIKDLLKNVTWSSPDFHADYMPLPENSNDQSAAAAKAGITLPSTVKAIKIFAGDGSKNAITTYNTALAKWEEPNPVYQYIYLYTSATVDDTTRPDQVIAVSKGGGTTSTGSNLVTVPSNFNGVIYTKDKISKLFGPKRTATVKLGEESLSKSPPAIASFMKMTIAGEQGVNIASDLTYSDTPCRNEKVIDKSCTKKPDNILGVYSQEGNVTITTEAPVELNIHAMLMSSKGIVTVDDYKNSTIGNRGSVHLIGGLIESSYGAFGTFGKDTYYKCVQWWSLPLIEVPSGTAYHTYKYDYTARRYRYYRYSTSNSETSYGCSRKEQVTEELNTGYNRDFTYDSRIKDGISPPYFPTSPKWKVMNPPAGLRGMDRLIVQNLKASDFK